MFDDLIDHKSIHYSLGNNTSLELRYFFLSVGNKWQGIAEYLGFSAEEIQGIVSLHPDNYELQVK